MFNTTNALVLREVRYKEADRMLTLLTSTDGKISAKARGALRKSSKTAAGTQQLTYSEMTLFFNKGKWTVNEATVKEGFPGLREDIEAFSLGSYFAECIEALSVEDQPDAELLQLGLNSLYALSKKLYAPEHIKAAFELRLMCISGYEPELERCAICGREDIEEPVLSLSRGAVCCRRCAAYDEDAAPLDESSLEALRYIKKAPAKQLFSFSISEESERELGRATERYLLRHTERSFSTLDYWNKLRVKIK